MEVFQIILIATLLLLITLILSSIFVLYPNWKYYKKIYKKLPSQKWYKFQYNSSEITIYNSKFNNQNHNEIIIFNDGSIKLRYNIYFHNEFYTYLDPYSLYWYLKYKKWIKNNININNLEDW